MSGQRSESACGELMERCLNSYKTFCPHGEGVGIEYHTISSGAIVSNSSLIISRMRRFSSERSDSAPNPAIHGVSILPVRRRICSRTPSVKNRFKIIPRLAVSSLACLKTASKSSTVVFMSPYYHNYRSLIKTTDGNRCCLPGLHTETQKPDIVLGCLMLRKSVRKSPFPFSALEKRPVWLENYVYKRTDSLNG